MTVYYNENDPKAAEWLRMLMLVGAIPHGDVDERSIEDVTPNDVAGYVQCHFFAGIGGWSEALRLAGWPDERPVWTGSCPCQPFSVAGNRAGTGDPRHLWPIWRWLIDQRRPPTIFGEQVASKDGRTWLAGVRTDLEALGYGVGAADLCAAGVGAPQIRQRLWWMADSEANRRQQECANGSRRVERSEAQGRAAGFGLCGTSGGLADANGKGKSGRRIQRSAESAGTVAGSTCERSAGHSTVRGMGDADNAGSQGRRVLPERPSERAPWAASLDRWLTCADGKARRIEPGLEPLAHGIPGRVGLLRGYGNAIVPEVAATFIEAAIDSLPHRDTR